MKLLCHTCKKTLPVEKFSKKTKSSRGYSYKCKDCHNTYVREIWYVKNADKQMAASQSWKDKNQARVLASKYKTTIDVIQDLLNRGRCDICYDDSVALHIDHCHETDEVRGILCRGCNHGLGNFKDDTDLLNRAIEYLGAGGR